MTVPNTSVSVACSVRTHRIAFILCKLIAAVLHLAVICSLKLKFSSMCVPRYLMTLLLCTSMLFTFKCVVEHLAIWWLEPMIINSVLPLRVTTYTQVTSCMCRLSHKSIYDVIRASSGDIPMMWDFWDDDIYITITSRLGGIKGWTQEKKGFPVLRF